MFLGEKLREKSNVFVHFVHLQNIEMGFFPIMLLQIY